VWRKERFFGAKFRQNAKNRKKAIFCRNIPFLWGKKGPIFEGKKLKKIRHIWIVLLVWYQFLH
jgi:hypothetical protein